MLKKYAKTILLFTGPLLFLIVNNVPLEGLSAEGQAVLACTAWIAFWWITEAVELPVASILPILIFQLSGAMTVEQTTSTYGRTFIFLLMCGFLVGFD